PDAGRRGAHRAGPIVRAAGRAGGRWRRAFGIVVASPCATPGSQAMKPNRFDYLRARSADEALEALAQWREGARIMAGGQSLMAVLNMRLAQPSVLVDISRAADLDYIRVNADHVAVGAATTQGQLEWWPELAERLPLLKQVIPFISHFQVRN